MDMLLYSGYSFCTTACMKGKFNLVWLATGIAEYNLHSKNKLLLSTRVLVEHIPRAYDH